MRVKPFPKWLQWGFLIAALALLVDAFLSWRVATTYDRLVTEAIGSAQERFLASLPETLLRESAESPLLSSPQIPKERYARLTLVRLNNAELRTRPEFPPDWTVRAVWVYTLNAFVGEGDYLAEIECQASALRWWARRLERTLSIGGRTQRVWGIYGFGSQFLTNRELGDARLSETLQRPVLSLETVYRARVRHKPQEQYVWGFFEGALYQHHSYTEAGVLEQSVALFRTREEAERAALWLQRADGVLERR
ncbi:MAG: hypothetical protein KatS3mg018_1468 [Fimbriimonadales bacterium]|nr:MAG: hypothetical protein KatS3mg018_1468 [Fimbriimonadales bacterium]